MKYLILLTILAGCAGKNGDSYKNVSSVEYHPITTKLCSNSRFNGNAIIHLNNSGDLGFYGDNNCNFTIYSPSGCQVTGQYMESQSTNLVFLAAFTSCAELPTSAKNYIFTQTAPNVYNLQSE
jgi:hypothetical protein